MVEKARIMDESDIRRAITRISHEIIERNAGPEGIVIAGIRTRGETMAVRVAERMRQIEGVDIP
ncbi:MAG: bifunctional pyr operon transcriptional regulator/uracil phosphoribosyltransferase, partial [Gemmatimonadota bacterium]|nr:bifunctional pyr operon transcriptional regulator/uracil phosphoribosyltransferase [Gemmatimonadota bacterium]